jgi:type VI secretion system protein ImpH
MIDAPALPALTVLRRIHRAHPDSSPLGGLDPGGERVRLRPALGLAFAAGEIEEVRELPDVTEVVLSLPALYGPASPLPTFITESLMGGERELARGLIDLLNHRLLSLTLLVAGRRQLEGTEARAERLAGLCGVAETVRRLRCSGLLRPARSAADLELLLADLCTPAPLHLHENIRSWDRIPREAQSSLGSHGTLGVDAVAGDAIETRASAFVVRLGPLPAAEARRFMPGGALFAAIAEAVAWFDADGLDWRIELLVEGASLAPAALDGAAELGRWARIAGDPPLWYEIQGIPCNCEP